MESESAEWCVILDSKYLDKIKKNREKVGKYLQNNGVQGLCTKIYEHTIQREKYKKWFLQNRISQREIESQRLFHFEYEPLISIVVPCFNTPLHMLKEMIESVQEQTYSNWELCIVVASEYDEKMENKLKKYSDKDERIHYKYLEKNMGISQNTNEAILMSKGEYIALLDHDDLIEKDALFEVVKSIQDNRAEVIYTDEDKVSVDLKKYFEPCFKPDFSLDLLRSYNYITHFFVVKKDLLSNVGILRSEFDGAQDYDLILRCVEKAKYINHIARILYHWRESQNSTAENPESKSYCQWAGKRALESHLKRTDTDAIVEDAGWVRYKIKYKIVGNPKVGIVSSRGTFERIVNDSKYKNIVWLESKDELQKLTKEKVDFILFLNDSIQKCKADAIEELLGIALQEDVAIVGGKLIDQRRKIRKYGLLAKNNTVDYAFDGISASLNGYMDRARVICNYSAVSADCCLISKAHFDEYDFRMYEERLEQFVWNYCIWQQTKGRRCVANPYSKWLVKMNKSSHPDIQRVKFKDKFYNTNLADGKSFEIRGKYE